ncbi:TraB/GumN family protein [Neptuniibacter sp. SY11_33]|uniref:TraB/GumN family protein n=1 Tax=Neptuniibacter sp. SY11_33 TaxID=3398215 RepID=UPI0039F47668
MFKFVLASSLLLSSIYSQASTSLWKVSNGDNILFIGATAPSMLASELPFPAQFDTAYSQSDLIAFATNVEERSVEDSLFKKYFYLEENQKLYHFISSELYFEVSNYALHNRSRIHDIEDFKPVGIAVALSSISRHNAGAGFFPGPHKTYFQLAKLDGKKVDWLESEDEYAKNFSSIEFENSENLVSTVFESVKSYTDNRKKHVDAWKSGDYRGLEEYAFLDFSDSIQEKFHQQTKDRTQRWLKKIENYSATPEIEFILLSPSQLLGSNGVLSALDQNGYEITQL